MHNIQCFKTILDPKTLFMCDSDHTLFKGLGCVSYGM